MAQHIVPGVSKVVEQSLNIAWASSNHCHK